MNFLEAFPEKKVAAPQMPGQAPQSNSVLHQLRLAQLRDLARAYEIPIDMDATKPDILPGMLQAEQSGTFRTPAKHPVWLERASVDPDARQQMLDPATQMGMTPEEHAAYHEERRRLRGGRPRKEPSDETVQTSEG
jgi:hypothetical protein